jgi:hypothetical protein
MNATASIDSIPTIRPSQVAMQARIAFETGAMLMLVGGGGAGKTSISCRTLPEALNMPLWGGKEHILSGLTGTEVTGYGNPQADGTMKFYAPDIWPTIERVGDKPYLMVLGELPDYSTEVRALLRGLTPSSGPICVGSHVLGPNVRFVITGNRRSDGTRGAVEDAPFTSRCAKFLLMPDVASWLSWSDTQAAVAGSFVPAFLKLTTIDKSDHFAPDVPVPYDGVPHANPRGWEAVARAEHHRKTDREAFDLYVAGRIGKRAALAYTAFLEHADRLPDIDRLRTDASYVPPTDPSTQCALVSACLNVALKGIDDAGLAVARGKLDWYVRLLQQVRGEIRHFGAHAAVRRGIPLDQHPVAAPMLAE